MGKKKEINDDLIGLISTLQEDDRTSSVKFISIIERSYLYALGFVAVLFLITCLMSLLVLYLLGDHQTDSDLMCFKCEEGTFTTLETKNGRCCIDKKEVIHDLVEKQKTGLIGMYPRNRGPIPVVSGIGAHKHLEINTPHKDTNLPDFSRSPYPLSINTRNDHLEYSNGVELSPEGITVVFLGLYFVYMSVYFLPDTNHPCRSFEQQTFYGKLLRKNRVNGQIDELMSSEHTCCPDCRFDRESAFTGGMFYLNEGDIIEVTVSAYGVVYVGRDITFMGIFMIGSSKTEQETTTAKSVKQSPTTLHSTSFENLISLILTSETPEEKTLLISEKPAPDISGKRTPPTQESDYPVQKSDNSMKRILPTPKSDNSEKQNLMTPMTIDLHKLFVEKQKLLPISLKILENKLHSL